MFFLLFFVLNVLMFLNCCLLFCLASIFLRGYCESYFFPADSRRIAPGELPQSGVLPPGELPPGELPPGELPPGELPPGELLRGER